jgi:hypothetical protein
MNCRALVLSINILLCITVSECYANVYVIIYTTVNGKTGHAGIAIDNYRIETSAGRTDTLTDGTLTYFDIWPEKDDFAMFNLSNNTAGIFYKLPNPIWPNAITVTSLYDSGIPHREHYPSDAILMIQTDSYTDYMLVDYLISITESKKSFNPRFYNCSDFVIDALHQITGKKIWAKEFMPFTFTSTPNKLCRKLMQHKNVAIIKAPDSSISRSFLRERIFKKHRSRNPFILAGS